MKLKLILLLLSLYVLSSISFCQQDSTEQAQLSFYELKATSTLLNELEYRRSDVLNLKSKIKEQGNIISSQTNIIALQETKEENLKSMIEEIKVPWYNRFWIGAGVVLIVEIIIFFLVN